MKRATVTIYAIIQCCFCLLCEDFYRDYLTGFSDISKFADESGYIVISKGNNAIVETQTFNTTAMDFDYSIRMKPTKSKGSRFLLSRNSGQYGIVWNYNDNNNYYALSLKHLNNDIDDIANSNHLEIEAYQMISGNKKILYAESVTENVNVNDGYNTLGLSYKNDKLELKIGDHKLVTLSVLQHQRMDSICKIGYFATKGCGITIKRIHFKSSPDKRKIYTTDYNKEILDSIFKHTNDVNQGYWVYLDRKMDENRLKLGGKYRIAIVPDSNGYKILLIDGNIKQPLLWKPFMIKGYLKDTAFVGNYDLEWIDADKNIISDESYATFSDNILTIHLPIFNSEVRFYKQQ